MQNTSLIINRDNKASKKISVITVCYNAVETLPATLNSIREQSSADFEFVVVDGASNDGTLVLLEENSELIDRMVSESDKGIYHAMNKGITLAQGEYLWFLNAGDTFHDKNTVEDLIEEMGSRSSSSIFYGDAMLIDEKGAELGLRRGSAPEKLNWQSLRLGMDVCHQAFLIKRTICPSYDTTYRIAADIDWMIRVLKQSREVEKTNLIFCNFLIGGMSSKVFYKSWMERYKVLRKHYGFWKNLGNHVRIIIKKTGLI